MRRETIDDRLLSEARAINTTAVRPFLTKIDESVDDDGYVVLRKQHIDALVKADDTKFLFREKSKPTGQTPGEGSNRQTGLNPFAKDSYDEMEQIKMFRENPELAKALAKQAGIPII